MVTVKEILGRRLCVGYNDQGQGVFQFRRWNISSFQLHKVVITQGNIEIETTNCSADKEESEVTVIFDETMFDLSKYIFFECWFWDEEYQKYYKDRFYKRVNG